MNKLMNYGVILLINFLWIVPAFFRFKAIINHLSTPLSFVFLFYSFFYLTLCIVFFGYFSKKRVSLFLAAMFGVISSAIIGSLSWFLVETVITGNLNFIIHEYHEFGLQDTISSIFIRSGFVSFHFIIGLLSAVTCFLIIEQISKKNARMSAHNMT